MLEQSARIRIAVQKSGRLTEHSLELLSRCGLSYSRGPNELICYGENMPVDVLLVRDDDIPGLVQEDSCDLGIVGLNVIEEYRLGMEMTDASSVFRQVSLLDYGHCRLSFGIPDGLSYEGPASLAGKRIATSYPRIVNDFLRRENIDATVVEFSGAVEIAPDPCTEK